MQTCSSPLVGCSVLAIRSRAASTYMSDQTERARSVSPFGERTDVSGSRWHRLAMPAPSTWWSTRRVTPPRARPRTTVPVWSGSECAGRLRARVADRVERTEGLLVEQLLALGHRICPVNPRWRPGCGSATGWRRRRTTPSTRTRSRTLSATSTSAGGRCWRPRRLAELRALGAIGIGSWPSRCAWRQATRDPGVYHPGRGEAVLERRPAVTLAFIRDSRPRSRPPAWGRRGAAPPPKARLPQSRPRGGACSLGAGALVSGAPGTDRR